MRIVPTFIQSQNDDVHRKGQNVMSTLETHIPRKIKKENDSTSEPFTKPSLCSLLNRMVPLTLGAKKQSIILNAFKCIMSDLTIQFDRVTTKIFGQSRVYSVVDDLSLHECEAFIVRWSEDLKFMRSKYRNHLCKISNVEKFKRSLECLNIREDQIQKLTEAQKDFHWFINILKSLPKSSVCQDGCATIELLNLYRQWKKGQLISMLPIMDFIMTTLLREKVHMCSTSFTGTLLKLGNTQKHSPVK